MHIDSNPSGELVIRNANQEHGGEYYCNVIDSQGRRVQSKSVHITVGELIHTTHAMHARVNL